MNDVRRLFEAKLKESGLTSADARRLGLSALGKTEVAELGFRPSCALRIDYFDADGKALDFFRLRFFNPGAGPKYVQPSNTRPYAYFPKGVPWARLAKQGAALVITEGELKAACACKHRYPTIGLGGVYAWKSTSRSLTFLPELEAFEWKQRPVYLVFDTDVAWKPQVRQALFSLAAELTKRGAIPRLVHLADDPSERYGLDDFLVARGAKALEKRFSLSEPWDEATVLWDLNDEVVLIQDPPVLVKRTTGQRMTARIFVEHAYAPWKLVEKSVNAKGEEKIKEKSAAKAWLEWKHRAQLEGLVYRPGESQILEDGWNLWPGWGVEPKKGTVEPWHRLLKHLIPSEEDRTWFERWCAIQLQRPGIKLYSAVLLWGRGQGTGKSLVGYTLGRIFGQNFKELHTEDLYTSWNDWAAQTQFVMGDEIASGSATAYSSRRQSGDIIKRLITREKVRINQKYVPTFEVDDCVNYYFTSNHPDAFYIEPGDRRFFIHEVEAAPLSKKFYDRYDRWYRGEGVRALFHHLLELDLDAFDPRAPAHATASKSEMIVLSASDLDGWAYDLVNQFPDSFRALGVEDPSELWTVEQLLMLYDPEGRQRVSRQALGRALKRAGARPIGRGGVTRTRDGLKRLYAVHRQERWAAAEHGDVSGYYDKHFGMT